MSISGAKNYTCFCDADGCKEIYEDLAQDEDEFVGQLESEGWEVIDRDHCYCPKHVKR